MVGTTGNHRNKHSSMEWIMNPDIPLCLLKASPDLSSLYSLKAGGGAFTGYSTTSAADMIGMGITNWCPCNRKCKCNSPNNIQLLKRHTHSDIDWVANPT